MLFIRELSRQLPAEQVAVNLVHPGLSWTQMTQSMTSQTTPALRLVWPLLRLVQRHRSPETAGRRVASLVASPQAAATGQYFERNLTPRRLPARHRDPMVQQRVWELGRQLVAQAPTYTRAG